MTKLKEKLTQARLKELLNYDPLTGVFSWLVPKHKCVVGEPCGSPHCKGYVQLRVEGYNAELNGARRASDLSAELGAGG